MGEFNFKHVTPSLAFQEMIKISLFSYVHDEPTTVDVDCRCVIWSYEAYRAKLLTEQMAKLNTIYKFIEVNTGNIQIFFHSTHILKLIIINETEQKHWSNKNHTLFYLSIYSHPYAIKQ